MDPYEQYVRSGLELAGMDVDEVDVQVMRVVDAVYGPELRALAEADLAGMWPEHDLDPSRAPRAAPSPR